jgi:hypothetical protein
LRRSINTNSRNTQPAIGKALLAIGSERAASSCATSNSMPNRSRPCLMSRATDFRASLTIGTSGSRATAWPYPPAISRTSPNSALMARASTRNKGAFLLPRDPNHGRKGAYFGLFPIGQAGPAG